VSHPIPLHTADRLERTLEALSQRVESSGDEGWVMRILAMLICRCLDHFVAMIEDLLAKIRAGTIVLPAWAYEQSANPSARETEMPVRATKCARSPALRRVRARRAAHAGAPARSDAENAVPRAIRARHRPAFTLAPVVLPFRRPDRGPPPKNFDAGAIRLCTTISLRYRTIA
jgi:hypothetical protein